jgi:radical S-adenosyl methionine domain-containing protein 2
MHLTIYVALSAGLLAYYLARLVLKAGSSSSGPRKNVPVSVNYHFTRRCNKTCGFCFHTATTSYMEKEARAMEGLTLLRDAGMRKINFAGGEPFLYPKFLATMLDHCKQTLRLESVSIVTNGSLVSEKFLRLNARNIDILAVSCDSFDEETNIAIGRGSGNQVTKLYDIAEWCARFNIKFKLNTVVCRLNHLEDMNAQLARLQPFRWKCFQVLIVAGENDPSAADPTATDPSAATPVLRDGTKFTISDAEFNAFCRRHAAQPCLVPEPNHLMAKSYLILDEYLRFLDRTGKQPSRPIVEVGVQEALASVFWDEDAFLERGGLYDWTKDKEEKNTCGGEDQKELEW